VRNKRGAAFRIWLRFGRCSAGSPAFLTNDVLRNDGRAFGPMGRRFSRFLRRPGRSGRRFFQVVLRAWRPDITWEYALLGSET